MSDGRTYLLAVWALGSEEDAQKPITFESKKPRPVSHRPMVNSVWALGGMHEMP